MSFYIDSKIKTNERAMLDAACNGFYRITYNNSKGEVGVGRVTTGALKYFTYHNGKYKKQILTLIAGITGLHPVMYTELHWDKVIFKNRELAKRAAEAVNSLKTIPDRVAKFHELYYDGLDYSKIEGVEICGK